ncbi:MAG: hypothetical protein ACJAUA_001194 [Zhongshania aliphaticivorans]|jgi:hypothetical protein
MSWRKCRSSPLEQLAFFFCIKRSLEANTLRFFKRAFYWLSRSLASYG